MLTIKNGMDFLQLFDSVLNDPDMEFEDTDCNTMILKTDKIALWFNPDYDQIRDEIIFKDIPTSMLGSIGAYFNHYGQKTIDVAYWTTTTTIV